MFINLTISNLKNGDFYEKVLESVLLISNIETFEVISMDELNELPEKRLKQLANMPLIESRITLSKDGKYVIHKTTITDIKPMSYYEKVFENPNVSEDATQIAS